MAWKSRRVSIFWRSPSQSRVKTPTLPRRRCANRSVEPPLGLSIITEALPRQWAKINRLLAPIGVEMATASDYIVIVENIAAEEVA